MLSRAERRLLEALTQSEHSTLEEISEDYAKVLRSRIRKKVEQARADLILYEAGREKLDLFCGTGNDYQK